MIVAIQMNDKYEFLVNLDDEAIKLLHKIGKARAVPATTVMEEIVSGGLCLQEHLFIRPDKSGT